MYEPIHAVDHVAVAKGNGEAWFWTRDHLGNSIAWAVLDLTRADRLVNDLLFFLMRPAASFVSRGREMLNFPGVNDLDACPSQANEHFFCQCMARVN